MITTLKLSRPIKIDNRELGELYFRDPASIGAAQLDAARDGLTRAEADFRLIAALADIPLTAIDQLTGCDLTAAVDTVRRLVGGHPMVFRVGDPCQ